MFDRTAQTIVLASYVSDNEQCHIDSEASETQAESTVILASVQTGIQTKVSPSLCRKLLWAAGAGNGVLWTVAWNLVGIHPALRVGLSLGRAGFWWWVRSYCK